MSGLDLGPVPNFTYEPFEVPTAESVLNEPGYQFRSQQGQDALQRSAASKGLLRSGGTLKDLIQYGQNFASNEYNNSFQRALQAYGSRYQLAKDEFAPRLAGWQTQAQSALQQWLAQYNRGTIWNNPHAGGGGGGGTYDPFPEPPPGL